MLILAWTLALAATARAEPFQTSDLSFEEGGVRFTVRAERLRSPDCAYTCWEEIVFLNSEQLKCLNDQVKEVRVVLANRPNASFLRKNGIQELRIKLTDNTRNTLPAERAYSEIGGFFLRWIIQVNATLTSERNCHVTNSESLQDLLSKRVKDEMAMEELQENSRQLIHLVASAPKVVRPAPEKNPDLTFIVVDPELPQAPVIGAGSAEEAPPPRPARRPKPRPIVMDDQAPRQQRPSRPVMDESETSAPALPSFGRSPASGGSLSGQ